MLNNSASFFVLPQHVDVLSPSDPAELYFRGRSVGKTSVSLPLSAIWRSDCELYMSIRVSPLNTKADSFNFVNTRILSLPPSLYRWRDRLTANHYPACYADQSIYN